MMMASNGTGRALAMDVWDDGELIYCLVMNIYYCNNGEL